MKKNEKKCGLCGKSMKLGINVLWHNTNHLTLLYPGGGIMAHAYFNP